MEQIIKLLPIILSLIAVSLGYFFGQRGKRMSNL